MPRKYLNIVDTKLEKNKILSGLFLSESGYYTDVRDKSEKYIAQYDMRMYYISTGNAIITVDNKEFSINQHDIFFQFKEEEITLKSSKKDSTEIWWIDYYGPGVSYLNSLLSLTESNRIICGLHDPRFLLELKNIFNYNDELSYADQLHITSSLYKVFALVIESSNAYEWNIIKHDNEEILYTGDWTMWPSPFRDSHEECYTGTPKSYVEYNFFGTGIKWVGTVNFDCGKADVIIDGIYQETVDTYNPERLTKQLLYINTKLSNDYHIIKIFCTGEKNDKATNCDIVLESFHFYTNKMIKSEKKTNNFQTHLSQKAVTLINQNISTITINSLAKLLDISRSYLTIRFTQDIGLSPSQYITKTKIDIAKQLLISTEMSISDIALEVGYNDVFYFSRAFKKKEKISPSYYRKLNSLREK